MQIYSGVKCVVQDVSKLIQHPYKQRTNTYIIMYVTSSYKQEQKMAKINGSEGMLQ
jgi:hypothetical protein